MTDTTYNGWSNRATWNVKLWLDNDEGTYREVQTLQRHADDKAELAQQLHDLCYTIWPTKQTPDGDPLSECDWDEVAEATWEDEDHEEKPASTPSAESDPADDPIFQPLGKFVEDNAIRTEAHRVPTRPDGLMSDSKGIQRHFRCVLTSLKHKRHMSLYFSQGSAHTMLPTAQDVLDCLASDASGFDSAKSFEDWAGDLGYDTDSRSAEKIYKTVKRQAEQLKRFLGPEAFDILLYKVERL